VLAPAQRTQINTAILTLIMEKYANPVAKANQDKKDDKDKNTDDKKKPVDDSWFSILKSTIMTSSADIVPGTLASSM
jgi:hypothetical protein